MTRSFCRSLAVTRGGLSPPTHCRLSPALSLRPPSSPHVIVTIIGLVSAVVDNVPLVAASMGMYSLTQNPTDSFLWEFMAYCAGTGGSILIIGSAAGVAAMGLEKIHFFWYVRRISGLALIGYLSGISAYIIQYNIFH
jgi:Na+/H+ antiporter NhaD/arsenite permease-like protein